MFKPRICGKHDPGLLFTQHQHGQSRIQTANLISFALFHENKPRFLNPRSTFVKMKRIKNFKEVRYYFFTKYDESFRF